MRPFFVRAVQRSAFRAAQMRDAAALARLHAEGFEQGWTATAFEQLLGDRSVLGHVAEEAPKPPHAFILSRLAADEAELLSILIGRRARGRGLGTELLGLHLSALAERGITKLFLEVEEGNAPARALYDRHGFETVGKRPSYYKRADGSSPAALVMRRDL